MGAKQSSIAGIAGDHELGEDDSIGTAHPSRSNGDRGQGSTRGKRRGQTTKSESDGDGGDDDRAKRARKVAGGNGGGVERGEGVVGVPEIPREVAEREYFGGEIQDRLGPAPARFDFTSAYTVEVSRFRENYGELQTKVMIEANKLSGKNRKECDVSVATILEDLERAKGPGRGASRGDEPASAEAPSTSTKPSGRAPSTTVVERVGEDDVILTVGIYHPEKPVRKMQEILVLGSQKLTALRDKIFCQRDLISKMNDLHVPSGFFFINGTFYDDMRNPKAIRYSDNIMDFIEAKQSQGRDLIRSVVADLHKADHKFDQKRMEDVTFRDLELKLGSGHPYVYCHQGCCEHRIAFLDIRIVHAQDRVLRSEYPQVVFHKFERRYKCTICGYDEGKYVVYNDRNAPCSPYVFCEDCHQSLHLSLAGKPLYAGYQLYEYPTGVPRET